MRTHDEPHSWSQFWEDLTHKRDQVLEAGEFLDIVDINNAIVGL